MADPVVHFEIQSKIPSELATFYSQAFGWSINAMEAGGYTYHVIDTNGGEGINGGFGTAMGQNVVTLYAAVDDLDKTVQQVAKLGGTVVLEPSDVMAGLRLAMFSDPEGNLVGVIQNNPGQQAQTPTKGAGLPVSWFEIMGNDGTALREFYSALFGWTFEVDESFPGGYGQIHAEAGISGAVGGSQWGPMVTWYLESADLPAALAKIEKLGGKTLMEPTSVSNVEFAQFSDPEGNRIGLYRNL